MRAFFNALFTPLARRLRGVSPNVLTLVSLLAGTAAGGAFLNAHAGRGYYWLAAALLAVSGTADSLDGIVARMYGRTSLAGEFYDAFGDRLTEVCVLAGIAFSPRANAVLGLAVLVVTLLHALLIAQVKATFGVRRYEALGKAEQFVAMIAFALTLGVAPDLAFTVGGRDVSLPDGFLAGLGAATVGATLLRLAAALRLCGAGGTDRAPSQ